MAFEIPQLPPEEFFRQIADVSPETLTVAASEALYGHYCELRRWNRSLALVGRGTVNEIVSRHYGESLAALALIPVEPGIAVDLGSGAGFPGFPLAATRPALKMVLVEARERKASFLLAAARRTSLPLRCLNARVDLPLPPDFPESLALVTVRAMKVAPILLEGIGRRLEQGGRILLWTGDQTNEPIPGLEFARSISLTGSVRRRIVELVRAKSSSG